MRRRVVLALGATLLVGALAGCSAGGSGSSAGSAGGAAIAVPQQGVPNTPAQGNSASGSGASKGASGQLPSVDTGRQVIRTASLALSAKNVTDAVAGAQQDASAAGGYVSQENATDDSAQLTLTVPQARLDSVLTELHQLGAVSSVQQQAQDVTDQLVDVTSRIATQQASVDRVRQLLAQATSISDIVQIEGELTTRESDLESMEHQQAELAGQVAMSTVSVDISRSVPPAAVAATPTPGFTDGLSGGWHALGATVRIALLVLGAALPFLLGIGIPVLVVLWLLRRRRQGTHGEPPTEAA